MVEFRLKKISKQEKKMVAGISETVDLENIRAQALENINLEGLDPDLLTTSKVEKVEIDALVILDIKEHFKVVSPATATGQLLGIDVKDKVEITNSFALPAESQESQEFQRSMLMNMKQLGYDANTVGWYTSTWLGSFWSVGLVETQYRYQTTFPQAVLVVYDPACSIGDYNLLALRLTQDFMDKFESCKFSMMEMVDFSVYDVFESIPIYVKNSHLLAEQFIEKEIKYNYPPLKQISRSVNRNELEFEEYLSRNFEFMGDCLDEFGHEACKWQGWSRAVGKEQRQKRSGDKAAINRNLTSEPSRLESVLILNQLETYCKQLETFLGSKD
jgi:translation initiation factor 3 subunit H